jgi:hypothetical protein
MTRVKLIGKCFLKSLLILFLFFNFISCPKEKKNPFAPGSPLSLIMSIILGLQNKPTFSPAPGKFTEAVTVKITNSKNNPGLPIYYTTNGTAANCSSIKYDNAKGVVLDLGRIYTLNAVECFEGIPSSLGSGEYSVGFCQNYSGIYEGRLFFIRNQFGSYSPTPIEGSYKYSISPAFNSCLGIKEDTGTISGTCLNTITEQEYRISRVLQTGNAENFSCLAKIGVYLWTNEAYLKAPNAETNDGFGSSVSIAGDTIIVAANGESSSETTITNGTTSSGNGAPLSGAAYVFRRTGTTWTNEAYLKAPNAEPNDQFGSYVSISGDTIVVGARADDSTQTTITNGTLSQVGDDFNLTNQGAAYVFRRTGSTWTNEAYLKAPNSDGSSISGGDFFGNSVSISGDTIVVSANAEDSLQTTITNGTLIQASDVSIDRSVGAAYVFRKTGTNWVNEAYLKAPNAEGGPPFGSVDQFGQAVSVSGDTIVVSSIREDSLQTTITNGTLIQISDAGTTNSGAAYVFRRTGTTWANEAYLKSPNIEAGDSFGFSAGIDGDTIVVTATGEDSSQTTITNGTTNSGNGANDSGAAYVFRRTGTNWVNEAYLKAPNAESFDSFGRSVAISINTIIVGANSEDSNQTTITNGTLAQASDEVSNLSVGAVYVFRRTGTTWVNEAYLKAPNAEQNDQFGSGFGPIGISGDTIVVGVSLEDSAQTTITNGTTASSDNNALSSGAAYVFRLK